jgi:hypothetical protein
MSNDEGPDAAPAFVCPGCCAEVLDLGRGRWWCDKCNQLYEGPDVAPAFVCPKCGVEAKNLGGGHRWCDRCCQHYRVAPDPPGLIWCPTTGPPPGGDPSARAWPPALFWAPKPPRLKLVEPPIVTYTTASSAPASAPTQPPPDSLDVVASTTNKAPVDAPSEAPAPELTPTEKEIVEAMFRMKAFGPDHPVTKDMIAVRSGAGKGVGENIKKLMTSLKGKGVVESSGSGRRPKSGYWLTELGRNLGETLARPKR